jgi:hypothetical protein
VPGNVRRFFLVESDKVAMMRFDSGGAPARETVRAELAAWKPVPVPGSATIEAVCALPKHPKIGLMMTWDPSGALKEGIFAPPSRWTVSPSPCPK